jgi:hypothetical protein
MGERNKRPKSHKSDCENAKMSCNLGMYMKSQ